MTFNGASNTNASNSTFTDVAGNLIVNINGVSTVIPPTAPQPPPLTHAFKPGRTLKGPETFDGLAVTFSHNEENIVAGFNEYTKGFVFMDWNATTGDVVRGPVSPPDYAPSPLSIVLALSSDGTKAASNDGNKLTVWDLGTMQAISAPLMIHNPSSYFLRAAFSADGQKLVASAASIEDQIMLLDLSTGNRKSCHGHKGYAFPIALSRDSKKVASFGAAEPDRYTIVWDAETLDMVSGPHQNSEWLAQAHAIAFSPDNRRISLGFEGGGIIIIDADTGDIVSGTTHFKGHTKSITSFAFSSDGSWLISGSADRTICVWDVKTGYPVARPLKGHMSPVRSIAISEDGAKIVSIAEDGTVRVWNRQELSEST